MRPTLQGPEAVAQGHGMGQDDGREGVQNRHELLRRLKMRGTSLEKNLEAHMRVDL